MVLVRRLRGEGMLRGLCDASEANVRLFEGLLKAEFAGVGVDSE